MYFPHSHVYFDALNHYGPPNQSGRIWSWVFILFNQPCGIIIIFSFFQGTWARHVSNACLDGVPQVTWSHVWSWQVCKRCRRWDWQVITPPWVKMRWSPRAHRGESTSLPSSLWLVCLVWSLIACSIGGRTALNHPSTATIAWVQTRETNTTPTTTLLAPEVPIHPYFYTST